MCQSIGPCVCCVCLCVSDSKSDYLQKKNVIYIRRHKLDALLHKTLRERLVGLELGGVKQIGG